MLDLSENNISEIFLDPGIRPSSDGSKLSKGLVSLNNNPIFCDCNNYGLLLRAKGVRRNNEPQFYLGSSTCSGPSRLKGKNVSDISLIDLICDLRDICPTNCTCTLRPATEEIIVDCDKIPTKLLLAGRYEIKIPSDYSAYSYSLNLRTLPVSLENLNIKALNLSNTNLRNITFEPNDNLKVLDVSHNNLTAIPENFLIANITFYAAGNPLQCDCALVQKLGEYRVADYKTVRCDDGRLLSEINVKRQCMWNTILMGYIFMGIIAGIL